MDPRFPGDGDVLKQQKNCLTPSSVSHFWTSANLIFRAVLVSVESLIS